MANRILKENCVCTIAYCKIQHLRHCGRYSTNPASALCLHPHITDKTENSSLRTPYSEHQTGLLLLVALPENSFLQQTSKTCNRTPTFTKISSQTLTFAKPTSTKPPQQGENSWSLTHYLTRTHHSKVLISSTVDLVHNNCRWCKLPSATRSPAAKQTTLVKR